MYEGVTKSGFSFTASIRITSDYRFIKLLNGMRNRETAASCTEQAVKMLLGDEGEDRLIAHLAGQDGICEIDKVLAEFDEIITILAEKNKELKNSSPSPA